MKDNGYFGIGCYNMKNNYNYGSLFRTAQIFDAAFLFIVGKRFKPQASDTMKSYRHMPVYSYDDLHEFRNNIPYDCMLIGIEVTEKSKDIVTYEHPKRAIYMLGSEDNGLSKGAINMCQDIVKIPGERCLNVSVAGSIVIYDRITKQRT